MLNVMMPKYLCVDCHIPGSLDLMNYVHVARIRLLCTIQSLPETFLHYQVGV